MTKQTEKLEITPACLLGAICLQRSSEACKTCKGNTLVVSVDSLKRWLEQQKEKFGYVYQRVPYRRIFRKLLQMLEDSEK